MEIDETLNLHRTFPANSMSDNHQLNKLNSIESVIAFLPGNMFWKDRHGFYLGCNNNHIRSFHLINSTAIKGKNIYELVPFATAVCIEKNDEYVMSTGKELIIEETWTNTKNEETFYLSHKIPLRDDKQNIIGLLGVSFDITERKRDQLALTYARKQLEETNQLKLKFISEMSYLDNILSILPGNIYWKNRQGVYLGCNDNMASLANLKSRKEFIGKTLYDFAEKELADKTTHIDERVMQTNQPLTIEEKAFDFNHKPAIYISHKTPLHDEKGNVMGLIGISFDISAQKQMIDALQTAKETAELASQAKTDFMMNMSHDIRTPFSGILSLTDFLSSQETDNTKKELLLEVTRSAQSLLNFLNEILDVSSIETGQVSSTNIKFDLLELVIDLQNLISSEIRNRHLEFNYHINTDIPKNLCGDKRKLQRILLNLISNAIKFTPKGKIRLDVVIDEIKEDMYFLRFSIADTGIGIPSDKFVTIFDRFTRLSPSHQGQYKGVGLGLYIVKRFTDEMHGRITVESEVGVGSKFHCILPFNTG